MRHAPEFEADPIGKPVDPDLADAAREAGADSVEVRRRAYAGEFKPEAPLDLRLPTPDRPTGRRYEWSLRRATAAAGSRREPRALRRAPASAGAATVPAHAHDRPRRPRVKIDVHAHYLPADYRQALIDNARRSRTVSPSFRHGAQRCTWP